MKQHLSSVAILDCTLRDGGYCNNWFFSLKTTQVLISTLQAAGVSDIEVGFRSNRVNRRVGPAAFSLESWLSEVSMTDNTTLWVMVNASDFRGQPPSDAIHELFTDASISHIGGVRIATSIEDLTLAVSLTPVLKELGYRVAVNLMQAARLSSGQVSNFAKLLAPCDPDILYLADTTGSLTPTEASEKIGAIRGFFSRGVGFHGHDNLGLALLNSVAAIEAGANIVDGTLLGMGRGAGNTKTEEMLTYRLFEENPVALGAVFDLARGPFASLREQHRWGYDPFYVASGLGSIHPDYASELVEGGAVNSREGLLALRAIDAGSRSSYSINWLSDAINLSEHPQIPEPELLSDRHTKIAGAILCGPVLSETELDAVRDFSSRKNLQIFAINDSAPELDSILAGRMFANPTKMVSMLESMLRTNAPLIAPFDRAPIEVGKLISERARYDKDNILYSIQDASPDFEETWRSNFCILDKPLALPYALAYLLSSGVREIFLAGFQGYSSNSDPRHIAALKAIEKILFGSNCTVTTLTESRYPLSFRSPYGP